MMESFPDDHRPSPWTELNILMLAIDIDSSMSRIWSNDQSHPKFPSNLMGGVRDTQGVVSVKQLTLRLIFG
ncbi:hypothetical protein NPIL_653131 [Nephila pilipes]|uniref:Uncharacterized protein n=1 Tax=Nephila pilipes TaxID=299642 RepID=A0A8X6NAY3_NEPPI|nr:hypothetical protein NPIL_653131 [Nephila pilipes]